KDFSDFVDQVTYIETVKEQVRKTIIEINKIKSSLEKQRGELNDEKSELDDLKGRKLDEQDALENQRQSKEILLEETKGEEEEFQKQLEAAMAEEAAIEEEIDKLIEEARKKLLEQYPNLEMDGEGFGYPLAGVNRISIIGGDYMDPYYGFGFPHTGVDLYAAQGTPIYAAASGVIVVAHNSGNSGLSYVAIQHPSGFLTKYLHMSEIFVGSGEYVARGEVIGLSGGAPGTVGAGYFTTGPHLHFEINDQNGNSVNPHNFLAIDPAY
ncbi:peptidoglycan DD-metalloendopeptidase family protein, partial [Patescibacteria group bacterium]|nr:peptidoglycan DD-metalloendopeptidase family protein [Patescibacteria group bacterium]